MTILDVSKFIKAGFDSALNFWNAVYDFTGNSKHANWTVLPSAVGGSFPVLIVLENLYICLKAKRRHAIIQAVFWECLYMFKVLVILNKKAEVHDKPSEMPWVLA